MTRSPVLPAVAVLFGLLASVAPCIGQETQQIKQELEKLERAWVETADPNVLRSIVAEDFIYTDADANVLNRQQYLDTVAKLNMTKSSLKDFNLRVYGNFAIVLNTWSGTYTFDNGPEVTETLRYTDVFIKRNGAWQAISSQATRVPELRNKK